MLTYITSAHALALQKKTFNQLKTAQCDEVEEKNFETAEGMKSTTSVSSAVSTRYYYVDCDSLLHHRKNFNTHLAN